MSESETVLVDVVRLVARGQADDVARRVGKLLRGVGGRRTHQLSAPCREALGEAVKEAGSSASLRRATAPAQAPVTKTPTSAPRMPAPAPILSPDSEQAVVQLIEEHRSAELLLAHGVPPTRSLLLSGPPGVGKTMAATYIAAELALPMHRAEPSTIVTSLLGESARNLAGAFETARREPSVLLLDEFDAFAKRRDDSYEVGELKRFVTTLLAELERGLPQGLLIAATNHPALLDPAVHRRFDLTLELGLPDLDGRRRILLDALSSRSTAIKQTTVELFASASDGASGSDVRRLIEEALRAHLLSEEDFDFALLRSAVERDSPAPRDVRAHLAHIARDAGLSGRETASLLGCSHTTVQRMLELPKSS